MIAINNELTLEGFSNILLGQQEVTISEETRQVVKRSHEFLKSFIENKIIYGINTGFGPMAQYRIQDSDRIQLQYNLIRSHSAGTGELLPPDVVKAAMLTRLSNISKGKSGIHISVVERLQDFINLDITPVIFAHGGVGASGDLVQLAHLALTLIGEGEVIYKGQRRPTTAVFAELGLVPVEVVVREGISLINGTSVMTGAGLVNYFHAKKLLKWSVEMSSIMNELAKAHDDHYSTTLNEVKKHQGQQDIARMMREHLSDSQLIRKREDDLYSGNNLEEIFKDKVQEYYSLRCVPQILGPILETISGVGSILENEVNSVSDNPIISVEDENVYHGGNFHGDYISLEMDKLKLAITRLTMLSERQLNYLMNAKINEILPPFVNMGKLGFNFGMQGAQFTATSTTAENQTLSNSMYVHSIPNNNDNQDIVSMGTNAAMITHKVIINAYEVLAIQMISLAQAIDILSYQNLVSSRTKKIYEDIRQIIPVFSDDKPLYPAIKAVKEYLMK
ncbi:aromatic amino acid lyase [Sphingobacterium alkalisoli]|uniref:Aromatic amino acid lyase n=1 Tax=Sphingobacterium alkalisoli TaxID=1874115 RepID=A0A4U0H8Z2_9SPHI|nr:aromatic amino acid ammonia-lyase [Sphingobacterium alkalisoli]TJY68246.1 aromatic amino acid lyase [Sphingobacterium alkalisoli]GGH07925.1 histidine ammonia-lyase [Sphingobacterium alkalisoli]